MKILFICRANVGRSQMAEAIFNKLTKKHSATSAGLEPHELENKNINEAKKVLECMKEIGCNLENKISKRLTKVMVENADKIIILGEKNNWPSFLENTDKIEYWEVEDAVYKNLEGHRKVRDEIKLAVERLIEILERKQLTL